MINKIYYSVFICIMVTLLGFEGRWDNAQTLLLFCIFGQLLIIDEKVIEK